MWSLETACEMLDYTLTNGKSRSVEDKEANRKMRSISEICSEYPVFKEKLGQTMSRKFENTEKCKKIEVA